MPDTDKLNGCSDLYLVRYRQGPDLDDLSVWVRSAKAVPFANADSTGHQDVDQILSGRTAILSTDDDPLFRVDFENFLAAHLVKRSYAAREKDENFALRIREYGSSRLKQYALETTDYDTVWPEEPVRHFGLITFELVINVLCVAPPKVRIVPNDEA